MLENPTCLLSSWLVDAVTVEDAKLGHSAGEVVTKVKFPAETVQQRVLACVNILGLRQGGHNPFAILGRSAIFTSLQQRRDQSDVLFRMLLRKLARHHQNLFRMLWIKFGTGGDAPTSFRLHGN